MIDKLLVTNLTHSVYAFDRQEKRCETWMLLNAICYAYVLSPLIININWIGMHFYIILVFKGKNPHIHVRYGLADGGSAYVFCICGSQAVSSGGCRKTVLRTSRSYEGRSSGVHNQLLCI